MHEQKFKDLLSSACPVSPDRIVLDLESEVMRSPGFIPTGGNIFHRIFLFSRCKTSSANIGIIGVLVHFKKTLLECIVSSHSKRGKPCQVQWRLLNIYLRAILME